MQKNTSEGLRKRIKENLNRIHPIKKLLIILLFIALISSFFFLKPAFIGYVAVTKEISYTDVIDLVRNQSSEYSWFVQNPAELISIKLTGSVSLQGAARVYIERNDGQYLIFDSARLNKNSASQNFYNLNETNQTEALNESIAEENNSIIISLEYNKDTVYDEDNDGIETTSGIIDFTVKNSEFELAQEKLCTKWQVANNDSSTTLCYGNKECCNFINLEPSRELWNDVFYLNYGAYGAGYDNIVSAQIVYVDYNLSLEDPYVSIVYSSLANLSALFYPEMIDFKDICVETCILTGFNDTVYKLAIEIENATLELDSIKYTTVVELPNKAPVFSLIPSYKIEPDSELVINLSDYAYDPDNDSLSFTASSADNLTVIISDEIATITPDKGFTGKRYIFFIANDTADIAVSNTVKINVFKKISFNRSTSLKQGIAVIGKPVKWVKRVKLNESVSNISINISEEALNFTVRKIEFGAEEEIDKEKIKVIYEGEEKTVDEYVIDKRVEVIDEEIEELTNKKKEKALDKEELKEINKQIIDYENEKNKITGYAVAAEGEGFLTKFFEQLFNVDITGYAVLNGTNGTEIINETANATEVINETTNASDTNLTVTNTTEIIINEAVEEVEIEYYTEAPEAVEINISKRKKQVIVSSDVHYENILTYSNIEPEAPGSSIKLYWLVNDTKKEVEFEAFDKDGNNLIDYIQWVTPYLSNQTYEIIIITKAEHLDENRSFISDVYGYVKEKDDNWTTIPSGDYIRVTFERNLTKDRDITIYVRSNGSASIEVYTEDGNETIAVFENISDEGWYKVYLNNLSNSYDNLTQILTLSETDCSELELKEIEGNHEASGEELLTNYPSYNNLTKSNCFKWKYFYELEDEKVATLNPITKELEWQKPTAYQEFGYSGEMFRVKTEEGDLIVSPEHKVYANILENNKNIGFEISGFSLMPVTEVYELVKEGREVMFMGADGGEIKVIDVVKEEYNGWIYDVDVENDIVLVRRKNEEGRIGFEGIDETNSITGFVSGTDSIDDGVLLFILLFVLLFVFVKGDAVGRVVWGLVNIFILCPKKFSSSDSLKFKTYAAKAVLDAISYYNKGLSLDKVRKEIGRRCKIKVSLGAVHSWIMEFKELCSYNRIRKKEGKLKENVLVEKIFNHLQIYVYRHHIGKLRLFVNKYFSGLKKYIVDVGDNCPDELFRNSVRCSSVKIKLNKVGSWELGVGSGSGKSGVRSRESGGAHNLEAPELLPTLDSGLWTPNSKQVTDFDILQVTNTDIFYGGLRLDKAGKGKLIGVLGLVFGAGADEGELRAEKERLKRRFE